MFFPILNNFKNEQINTITSGLGFFSTKETMVIRFNSGRSLTICPEEKFGLWKFIEINKYGIYTSLDEITLGKKNSDIFFFPNSNYHSFYNTEEVSGLILLKNMIITDISGSKRGINNFDGQNTKITIVNRIHINGKINFDKGYNYILFSDDSPKMEGITEVSLSISAQSGLPFDIKDYNLIIK